jgi:hypothetical protein
MVSPQIYRTTSGYDARVAIRPALMQGGGMLAWRPLQAGEIVAMMGGTVMTEDEFHAYLATTSRFNATQIGEHPCQCGTTACRHTIRGNDWQLPGVQQRYQGHFAPFINERILKSNQR